MEPSLTLFLASLIFGFGFAVGQALFNGIVGLLKR